MQRAHFSIEIEDLKNNHNVSVKSKINKLNPFIDGNGFVRVGGRLANGGSVRKVSKCSQKMCLFLWVICPRPEPTV